ncbi:MAG: TIGR03560 family F420-dependent LLM class oxidoreductase [Candidatus Bathyarchaeota archaeon]|nr:TIGR03560 family F420-dependent LLM class oxidoreductase [Candidatus Bathyarchaeota archaeon]
MKKIKIGVFLHAEVVSKGWEEVKRLAYESERLGYDSLWLGDHVAKGTGEYRLECWTLLSALATLTKRIRLGPLVLSNQFRHPPVLAKMAATLDMISGGRLEFGIGTGWHEGEHLAYGLPFPKPRIRAEILSEAIEIIKRMWIEEKPSFEGRHYRIKDALCEPKPLQKPHPPITVGGGGKHLLKVVAKHADRWDSHGSVDNYGRKLWVLKEYCSEIGRDFDSIEKSTFSYLVSVYENEEELLHDMKRLYERELKRDVKDIYQKRTVPTTFKNWFKDVRERSLLGTPEQCVTRMQEYIDLGVSYFMLRFLEPLGKRNGLKIFAQEVMNKVGF